MRAPAHGRARVLPGARGGRSRAALVVRPFGLLRSTSPLGQEYREPLEIGGGSEQ